jgi:hypothetical protein
MVKKLTPVQKEQLAAQRAAKAAARIAERAAARALKDAERERKKEENDLLRAAKRLFSFENTKRLYTVVESVRPKGGPTQAAWESVALAMNRDAAEEIKGKYDARNCYDCWVRWNSKHLPTGNPQLGDDEELALMTKIKALEVEGIVGAMRPEEQMDSDPTCMSCNRIVRGTARLFYWARQPDKIIDGESMYRPGSHMQLTAKEMLYYSRHPNKDSLMCLSCVQGHYAKQGYGEVFFVFVFVKRATLPAAMARKQPVEDKSQKAAEMQTAKPAARAAKNAAKRACALLRIIPGACVRTPTPECMQEMVNACVDQHGDPPARW